MKTSFLCICGENWFCRCSVDCSASDRIYRPRKRPFYYAIPDLSSRHTRQISAFFPSTKNIFPAATKSISSRRYQLFRVCLVFSLSRRRALSLPAEITSGRGLFFPPDRSPTGVRPDLSHTLCKQCWSISGRISTLGRSELTALFFLSIYPGRVLCYHVKKNIKKTGTSLASRSLSHTMRYAAVTERCIPHLMRL